MAPTQATRALLCLFGLLGAVQLWGRSVADGTLAHLLSALDGQDAYQLPGTNARLRASFTGVFPIDYLLRVLVVFFWEVADGSHPTASVIGVYFLGQLFPILVVFYFEADRRDASSRYLSPTAWLMTFQLMGIGCAGPLWALWRISASADDLGSRPSRARLQRASLLSNREPFCVLLALCISYVGGAILMALPAPGVLSYDNKQVALVLWNIFPVTSLVCLVGFRAVRRLLSGIVTPPQEPSLPNQNMQSTGRNRGRIVAVGLVYFVAFVVGFFFHAAVVALSTSTKLFPALFKPEFLPNLSPTAIFVPPISVTARMTVGDGTRSFMLWDQVLGYATVAYILLLGLRSAAEATATRVHWCVLLPATLLSSMVVGPGSTCLLMSWARDVLLCGD